MRPEVVERPLYGQRHILHVAREGHLWNETVVGDHGGEALFGEAVGYKGVVRLVAGVPITAVHEDHHVAALMGRGGGVDIEHLPLEWPVGDVSPDTQLATDKGIDELHGGATAKEREACEEDEGKSQITAHRLYCSESIAGATVRGRLSETAKMSWDRVRVKDASLPTLLKYQDE